MTRFEHPAFELLAQGQLAQAAAEARRALTERPDDPELLACLGEATVETDPTEARAAAERASSARPDDAALLLAVARVQWRTGDHLAATSTARRVTALAPEWAEGQATSAVITLDQSQRGLRTSPVPDLYEQAKAASASVLASAADWPLAHIVSGQVELADGNHDEASAAAKAALSLDSNNLQALVLLGDATHAGGDKIRADRIYEQARSWPPAAERLRDSTKSRWLRPTPLLVAMFGALLLGTITRSGGQPVIGSLFSLLGLVAAGLVLAGSVRQFRRRRATARQEVARLLTPGSELVGGVGGNTESGPTG